MDIRSLQYFITVAEELNITKAAEKLHMSQPPLWRKGHPLPSIEEYFIDFVKELVEEYYE